MSVIALSGAINNYSIGINSYGGFGASFLSAVKSSGGLYDALSSLKSKIDISSTAASVDSSQEHVNKAHNRESIKNGSLTLSYEKLDKLICTAGDTDLKVSDKISEREDGFYNKYEYLKPEYKKSKGEQFKDWVDEKKKSFLNTLSNLDNAINNCLHNFSEWCKNHWISIVTAIAVIAVAIVAAVFLGPAVIAAICAAIAFFCMAADLISMVATGEDLYSFLKDKHPVLAEIFAGVQWGTTIASVALSFIELGGQIMKVGLKGFLTGGEKGAGNILKNHVKNIISGVKKDFSSVFGHGLNMKTRLRAILNIVVFNQSGDFRFGNSISKFRESQTIMTIKAKPGGNSKYVVWDGDQLKAKSGSEFQVFLNNSYPDDNNIVKLTEGKVIEFDPKHYSDGKSVGKADIIEIYSQNKETMFDASGKVIWNEGKKRNMIWGNAKLGKAPSGFTHHEPYKIFNGKIQIYDVPSVLNNKYVTHNGGTYSATKLWEALASGTFLSDERRMMRRNIMDLIFDIKLQQI